MTEVVSSEVQSNESEVLHYYTFRNISVKLVKRGDKYLIVSKKHILYFFKKIKRMEFNSYYEAEDKYLELKSSLQFHGRTY